MQLSPWFQTKAGALRRIKVVTYPAPASEAVVKAEVLAKGTNIRIRGRGILDGSNWQWRTGPVGNLIAIRNSTDIEVSGITLPGSSHWTIVPRNSRRAPPIADGTGRVTIRNVKLCNPRVQNDDGINPCNSQHVQITDCFIRSDDDCVALKGLDFSPAPLRGGVLWCDRARIFLLGHESRAAFMRNVTLRNLDIIHFSMTPFLLEPGEDMRLEDITIEDIRIHGQGQSRLIRLRPVVNPAPLRGGVTVEGQSGDYLVQIQGADDEHDVRDVTFENVSIMGSPRPICDGRGSKLTEGSKRVPIGKHTKNVRFYAEAQ